MNLSNSDLPLGLSMALMENLKAFTTFAHMSDVQKQSVISGSHSVNSKQEMQAYVNSIARQG